MTRITSRRTDGVIQILLLLILLSQSLTWLAPAPIPVPITKSLNISPASAGLVISIIALCIAIFSMVGAVGYNLWANGDYKL